jgi:hypothetical protein
LDVPGAETAECGEGKSDPDDERRVPKEGGKTRPIGISVFEDKLVQDAVRKVLEAIYEQDFLPCSYGFRPDRSAHDAVRALDGAVHHGRVNWILEADIVSYFDRVDRTALIEMLRGRIADESLLRLVGKCLHVGVLDSTARSIPSRAWARSKGRCSHRCSATCICTTCWIRGSSAKSNRGCGAARS